LKKLENKMPSTPSLTARIQERPPPASGLPKSGILPGGATQASSLDNASGASRTAAFTAPSSSPPFDAPPRDTLIGMLTRHGTEEGIRTDGNIDIGRLTRQGTDEGIRTDGIIEAPASRGLDQLSPPNHHSGLEGSTSPLGMAQLSPTQRIIDKIIIKKRLEQASALNKEPSLEELSASEGSAPGSNRRQYCKLTRQGSDLQFLQTLKAPPVDNSVLNASRPRAREKRSRLSDSILRPPVRRRSSSGSSSKNPAHLAIKVFNKWMNGANPIAVAVASIQALTYIVKHSQMDTMMGLKIETSEAADALIQQNQTSISLRAACDLFKRYVSQTWNEMRDFEEYKKHIIMRGEAFAAKAMTARNRIAALGAKNIIRDRTTILTHSMSRVVVAMLKEAAQLGRKFNVIVTETRPSGAGLLTARECVSHGIPVSMVLDSAAASVMAEVDFVLVGAEGVVESGGIIHKIGTYNLALIAKASNTPFYVAAESYKFTRLFPLTQSDIPVPKNLKPWTPCLASQADIEFDKENIKLINRTRDYTPPEHISLLFTDLGILTPSAVSDELIKLHR